MTFIHVCIVTALLYRNIKFIYVECAAIGSSRSAIDVGESIQVLPILVELRLQDQFLLLLREALLILEEVVVR